MQEVYTFSVSVCESTIKVIVCSVFLFMYNFLYDAVLSMAPHTRLYFQLLCACLSTPLPFTADDSFSASSSVAKAIFILG